MKKAILTALSLILLLLPLTACGADSASTAADTPSPTATSTPAPTQKPAAAPSAKNTSFTNKFGTSKTICAHSGCSSYIPPIGGAFRIEKFCRIFPNKTAEAAYKEDEPCVMYGVHV